MFSRRSGIGLAFAILILGVLTFLLYASSKARKEDREANVAVLGRWKEVGDVVVKGVARLPPRSIEREQPAPPRLHPPPNPFMSQPQSNQRPEGVDPRPSLETRPSSSRPPLRPAPPNQQLPVIQTQQRPRGPHDYTQTNQALPVLPSQSTHLRDQSTAQRDNDRSRESGRDVGGRANGRSGDRGERKDRTAPPAPPKDGARRGTSENAAGGRERRRRGPGRTRGQSTARRR